MKRFILIAIILLFLFPSPAQARDGGGLLNNPFDNPPTPSDDPEPPPPVEPVPTGPFYGLGLPWADTDNAGYCPGYGPYGGFGWDGVLDWPSEQHYVRENRRYRAGHTGIDIDMPSGTTVYAAEGGRVVWSGYTSFGFGELVVLAHGWGWLTFYAHLSVAAAGCGQYVNTGGVVGLSGQTGAASWEHLHFELRRDGLAYDPLSLLQ